MPYVNEKSGFPKGLTVMNHNSLSTTEETANLEGDDDAYLVRRVNMIREGKCEAVMENQLGGVRGEYLEALRANVVAQRRCAQALQRVQQTDMDIIVGVNAESSAVEDVKHTSLLQKHLQVARLQKQHGGLVGLKDEFEALRLSRGSLSLETDVEQHVPDINFESLEYGSGHIMELVNSVQSQVKRLEIALIQDRHEAGRQAAVLKKLKCHPRQLAQNSVQQRLSALSATRNELTVWLEESLENCQDDVINSPGQGQLDYQGARSDNTEIGHQTDAEYDRYLEARKRLLSNVSALRVQVPDFHSENQVVPSSTEQDSTLEQRNTGSSDNTLVFIEQNLVPAMMHNTMIQKHSALTEEQLFNEISSVVRMIERLSDESQLLQAFPMLAKSGRFRHASSVFGSKSNEKIVVEDEITQRIEPWLFSANAADVAAEATIHKQVQRGKEAIETVSKSLTELRLLMEANGNSTFGHSSRAT
ncbi:hypothetical protein LTR84_006072 [Exophiala bonariae]|uniref:Up-regulated during septation protein 1 domain-containing protein n=1 Tax=Exophiala bonariae TaxID=1690606 RepID=A0AAV9N1G9_9EURO|nr:hypothetical protein LTR84_006072 [Exophiala bonariae]